MPLLLAEGLLDVLHGRVGYLAPFALLVLAGMGLPIPEEVTLLGCGILVHEGHVEFVLVVAVCLLATLIGDSIPYWVGRRLGRRALEVRPVRRVVHPERFRWIEERFERHGVWAMLICRFVPGVRLPCWFLAGTLRTPYPKFLLIDAAGGLVVTPVWVWLGLASGEKIAELRGRVESLHQILGFVVVALAAILVVHLVVGHRVADAGEPSRADRPGPAADDLEDGDRP